MDGVGWVWMTTSQLGRCSQLGLLGLGFPCWARWAWFFIAKIMYYSKYNTSTCILAFSVAQWRQESVDSIG